MMNLFKPFIPVYYHLVNAASSFIHSRLVRLGECLRKMHRIFIYSSEKEKRRTESEIPAAEPVQPSKEEKEKKPCGRYTRVVYAIHGTAANVLLFACLRQICQQ